MSEPAGDTGPPRLGGRVVRAFGWLAWASSMLAEGAVSPRALAALFFAGSVALASIGWLRPPLSPDIRPLYIPLGLWGPGDPERLLRGPRSVPPDSGGVLLLATAAAGAFAAVRRPERLPAAAGLLLCAAVCVNAAATYNHPALVELMDLELEQWQRIDSLVPSTSPEVALVDGSIARVDPGSAPSDDGQRGDLDRGAAYRLYGWALTAWASLGVLLAGRGSSGRRLARLSAWLLAAAALSGLLCSRRLAAEFHWERAEQFEAEGRVAEANRALDTALALRPDFGRMERGWLFAGKLDYRAGLSTDRAAFFLAYQIARDKETPRSGASLEDLPCLDTGELSDPGVGAPTSVDPGATFDAYRLVQDRERYRATDTMRELALGSSRDAPAVRRQYARILSDTGFDLFRLGRPLAAREVWRRSIAEGEPRLDATILMATAQARVDHDHPELAEAEVARVLDRLADRAMRADVQAMLGAAYFESGQMTLSRRRNAESFGSFSLPKVINFKALLGLGGL